MRILFTFVGGSGHYEPLVPIARAATSAAHAVAVAGRHSLIPTIEAAGFTAFATGKASSGEPSKRLPLQRVDLEREARDLRDGFADRAARSRSAELLALCEAWQPDLLVCDEVDFGAMIAAERFGIPYASVNVIVSGSFIPPDLVVEPLNRIRAEHGLPPDPDMAMLSRYLVLSPAPPSFRDPAYPPSATTHAIRPASFPDPNEKPTPLYPDYIPGAPTIYFTLGTIFNTESGDLFQRVLRGLRHIPINVIATVGRDIDPEEFGTQPPNFRIDRYIPQSMVLRRTQLAITHGGSGSVIGALAHGVPLLLLPMGADQPQNADRCEALGVGKMLDAFDLTPDLLRETVLTLLREDGYRQAAGRLRDEIASLPPAAHAVTLLERLAAEKQPILSR